MNNGYYTEMRSFTNDFHGLTIRRKVTVYRHADYNVVVMNEASAKSADKAICPEGCTCGGIARALPSNAVQPSCGGFSWSERK
jgi:hypothetical protein